MKQANAGNELRVAKSGSEGQPSRFRNREGRSARSARRSDRFLNACAWRSRLEVVCPCLDSTHHVHRSGGDNDRGQRLAEVAPPLRPQHSRLLPVLRRQRLPHLDADLGDLPSGTARHDAHPDRHDRVDLLDHRGARRGADRGRRRSLGVGESPWFWADSASALAPLSSRSARPMWCSSPPTSWSAPP